MSEMDSKLKKGQVIPFLQDGSYFYKKGIEAYQAGNLDQAINYIERAIRIEPEEPVFLCQLAIVLSEKGDFEGANDWLEKIIKEIDNSMSECYFFMANNLAHLGKFDQAKLRLKKYLQLEPDGEFTDDAHSLLYMLEEEGLTLFADLDDLNMEPTPLENIVDLLNKGDYEWAEKEARGYLMENPKEWDVYAYLAESLMYQGDTEHAKSILKDLLMKEEPNFLAQCNMTLLLAKTGDEGKETWVKNLINLRPMKDWHCYYLARTLFYLGEYAKSYKWFQKLYRESDFQKQPAYFHQMAIVAWKNGNITKAKQLFEKTEELDQENEEIARHFLDRLSLEDKYTLPEDEWFIYSQPGKLLTNPSN
ncbi:tetratricopeptide (TPR) repeat protein [Evansella vedderi]|uniref:Tetratricopeptide (TPR) repeat protein n=1 Tax=Evansella vedderi TaxID=38282 RepID=A0ABT9ZTK8_9BACI|nr:tetratricopeptide repeat protein [Evansella vedderi]MDQ0254583.1 tetratricopeptide (TPR) repeat protein [Evansella vedderi]